MVELDHTRQKLWGMGLITATELLDVYLERLFMKK